jgi:UMP-CMP kinase
MTNRILGRSESSGRSDDNLNSILKRFKVYNEETKFVIDHFQNLNKLVEVNSEGEVEAIFK